MFIENCYYSIKEFPGLYLCMFCYVYFVKHWFPKEFLILILIMPYSLNSANWLLMIEKAKSSMMLNAALLQFLLVLSPLNRNILSLLATQFTQYHKTGRDVTLRYY